MQRKCQAHGTSTVMRPHLGWVQPEAVLFKLRKATHCTLPVLFQWRMLRLPVLLARMHGHTGRGTADAPQPGKGLAMLEARGCSPGAVHRG